MFIRIWSSGKGSSISLCFYLMIKTILIKFKVKTKELFTARPNKNLFNINFSDHKMMKFVSSSFLNTYFIQCFSLLLIREIYLLVDINIILSLFGKIRQSSTSFSRYQYREKSLNNDSSKKKRD
jgi:hypothetical protein